MLAATPDALLEVGLDGVCHDFRVSSTGLLPVSYGIFTGRQIDKIFPADAAAVFMTALQDANRNGVSGGYRCCIEQKWFELSVAGKNVGPAQRFIVLMRDISDRMHLEEDLVKTVLKLRQEVGERTDDLAALAARIQDISEIEKASLARELHDELGSTLSCLSIEIRRIEQVIRDQDILREMSKIKELISHAAQIKRKVVDCLYPTMLDNCGLVPAIKWQLAEFQKHSGIKVELTVPEEINTEHVYALAAYRIVQECLTNIIKHAEASRVEVTLDATGEILDITVRDNGKGLTGIPDANGHGIFGMSERARFLGGAFKISNAPEGGTLSHLKLPLATNRAKVIKRVLLVDDHESVRSGLRDLLHTQSGEFRVAGEARDGKEAVQMAVSGDWDVVLLDITLPHKNGLQVLEEVKSARPELPVIMLSNHPHCKYGGLALAKGAADYIEKTETDKLVGAMQRALSTRSAGSAYAN